MFNLIAMNLIMIFRRLFFIAAGGFLWLLIGAAHAAAPVVTGVTSSTANATYNTGASISIQVTFDQSVTVTGAPALSLNSGGTATYASGSPGTTLTFSYIVGATDNSSDLDYSSTSALSLDGGSILLTSDGTTAATLTLPTPGAAGSLGTNKAIIVADNTAPTLDPANIEVNNSAQPNTIRLTFSEPLSSSTATTLANYTVTNNAASLTYTLAGATLTSSNVVTLTLAATNPADTKTYITNTDIDAHLKVTPTTGLKDANEVAYAAGAIMESGATHIKDSTAPTLNAAPEIGSTTTLVLTFSEKVDKTLATTATNYTLSGTGGLTGSPSAVVLDATGTKVTLTVPSMAALAHGKTVIVTAATAITDLAGNALSAAAQTATLTVERLPTLSFEPVDNSVTSSVVESEAVTLDGLNLPTQITVSADSHASLKCAVLPSDQATWGTFAACNTLTVNAGDQLKLSLTSASTAATSVSGTITIGGSSATFTITTASLVLVPTNVGTTPLTSLASAIQFPDSRLYISSNGLVVVPATVTSQIVISYGAPVKTGFSIQRDGNASFLLGGNNLSIQPTGLDSVLAVLRSFAVDDYSALQTLEIARGRATISSSSNIAPIVSIQLGIGEETKQVAIMSASTAVPVLELQVNNDGTGTVAVKSGKVLLRQASDDSTIATTDAAIPLYANEVASLSSAGEITEIRIGSLDNNGTGVGDPLEFSSGSIISVDIDRRVKIPRLGAPLARINGTDTLLEALFDAIGLRSNLARGGQTSQGIIPLLIGNQKYYFVPFGDVTVDTTRADGVILTKNGVFEVTRNGVMAMLRPAILDTSGFATNMAIALGANVGLGSSGMIEIAQDGDTLLMVPEMFTQAVAGAANGIAYDENGYLTYTKNGERQRMLPAFYDSQQLETTFADLAETIGVQDNLDGTVTATLSINIAETGAPEEIVTTTYVLAPEYRVISPFAIPVAHNSDPWWIGDDGLFYFKYGNRSAQGFSIR